jgi:hypothetical protein
MNTTAYCVAAMASFSMRCPWDEHQASGPADLIAALHAIRRIGLTLTPCSESWIAWLMSAKG